MLNSPMTWEQARATCASYALVLADVSSEDLAVALTNAVQLLPVRDTCYWLGGSDLLQEGSWIWASGQPWGFTR
jgi:hypothetical protein